MVNKRKAGLTALISVIAVAGIGGGIWWYLNSRENIGAQDSSAAILTTPINFTSSSCPFLLKTSSSSIMRPHLLMQPASDTALAKVEVMKINQAPAKVGWNIAEYTTAMPLSSAKARNWIYIVNDIKIPAATTNYNAAIRYEYFSKDLNAYIYPRIITVWDATKSTYATKLQIEKFDVPTKKWSVLKEFPFKTNDISYFMMYINNDVTIAAKEKTSTKSVEYTVTGAAKSEKKNLKLQYILYATKTSTTVVPMTWGSVLFGNCN